MDERARRVFRSFMVGSAVAATLATLEAGGHPALAATNSISFTSGSSPYPPDWFQSYQRGSVVENCAPTWNPSWAMWANNSTGGFVCVRTQYYDPGLAAWSYR